MTTPSRLDIHTLDSEVLRGNAPGDPTRRDLWVYVPPGYDPNSDRRYPVLLAIVGYMGTGAMLFNTDPVSEDLKRRLDRLITSGQCPPVIVAAPDCFTRFGGNQYINSSATGRYEDYLFDEIIPFVNRTYRTAKWGVFGKSSGGYGSIVLGMRHPDVIYALADHSGDACFELCYIGDFAGALDAYRDAGGPAKWLEGYWADDNRKRSRHFKPLNVLGMAAHYSPDPASPHLSIALPFDLDTGVFRPEVWERWRAWDPVNMVAAHATALAKVKAIYVDCGRKDEYALIWGARALVKNLRDHGLSPRFEEFDDGHGNLSYRYDVSIPYLVNALVAD